MKEIRHRDKDFTIQGVASAYESGYEVAFKGKDDWKCWVQFRVLLNSSMNLVAVVNRISDRVSIADVVAAKEIAAAELASNPSVFHIVENASYEMKRLRRAVDDARSLHKLEDSDPNLIATEARIADLDKIVKEARQWSSNPSRYPFRQFMEEHEIVANRRDFDAVEQFESDDDFRFHSAMGPIELLHGVLHMERKPESIVVISDMSVLTPVWPSVLERQEFDWPRVGREIGSGISVTWARMFELVPKIADHVIEKMSNDAVVVGWTRQTETAAFEKILDRLEAAGLDPRVVIGSPEGTFSGRASAIRLALSNAPALAQATSGPAL